MATMRIRYRRQSDGKYVEIERGPEPAQETDIVVEEKPRQRGRPRKER